MSYHYVYPVPPLPPGTHQVVYHAVGPSGPNGTQQFPKLSDCDLVEILYPMISNKIMHVYANNEINQKICGYLIRPLFG
jgi:hypothetical protein